MNTDKNIQTNPQKDYLYFLHTCHDNLEPTEIYDSHLAYATGYVCALHKTHTYSPCLVPIDMVAEHSGWLFHAIAEEVRQNLYPDSAETHVCALDYQSMKEISPDPNGHLIKNALCVNFVNGYMDAIRVAKKYDNIFRYCTGHPIHINHLTIQCIIADMLAYEQAEERGRRASARIMIERFGLNKDELRGMALDTAATNNESDSTGTK